MDALPDCLDWLHCIPETPLAVEAARIEDGAPWAVEPVAGLQFYAYAQDDGLEGRVRPLAGDRLHLMRRPDNQADRNAVEVWFKNEYALGHLSRRVAEAVAPLMDAGKPIRAYVVEPGDGSAWSLKAILVGEAVAPLHGEWMERVVENAWSAHDWQARKRAKSDRMEATGRRFEDRIALARRDRLRQAVAVLSTVPFEPALPPEGSEIAPETIGRAIGVSPATAKAMVKRLGIEIEIRARGHHRHALPFTLTPALRAAVFAFAQAPKAVPTRDIRPTPDPYLGWFR